MPAAKEFATLGGDKLINHAKVVGVDALQEMIKIAHKLDIVVFRERFEEIFVSLIRSNVDNGTLRHDVLDIVVNLVRFNASSGPSKREFRRRDMVAKD